MLRRTLYTLFGMALLATAAYATLNRAAPLSGSLTSVITDINEELTFLFQQTPQPLDTLAGTNTYTASVENLPPLTAYVNGNKFRAKIPNTNTSTTISLNIDGLGAISVVDRAGSSIPVGGLLANSGYEFEYYGAADNHFRVMSPLAPTGTQTQSFCAAASDEITAITVGTAKVTFHVPYAFTLTGVSASVNTVSTSGTPTVDINEDADAEGGGAAASILSTKLTIDANERRSSTAAIPAVISDASLAANSEMTIDVDVAGTGAKGLKVCLIGGPTP